MWLRAVPLILVLAACAGSADDVAVAVATTTTIPATTTTSAATTSTTEPPVECGEPPYEVGVLPPRVDVDQPSSEDVPLDEFTTLPGTRSRLWFDDQGEVVLAFIRGALPPRQWPGDRGEVSIDGARGVAGPFEDGSWVVAWFEGDGEERCDRYFMVFYPPVEPAEVEATIASMDRRAG